MKLTILKDFFNQNISVEELKKSISNEVGDYKQLLSKRGSSIPIVLNEDTELSISIKDIAAICQSFLDDQLNEYEIYYIADALHLSDKVSYEDDRVSELLEELTDPEVNGHLTKSFAKGILSAYK